jgi:20S proteasome alpha/beta subunit
MNMLKPLPLPKIFRPKIKRLPKRKTMTIAIGIRGNEGIVLAADSQETISGYVKSNKGKIYTSIYPRKSVCAFVGSGTSDYIATAIEKACIGIGELETIVEIEKTLENNLLDFFDKHLARWSFFAETERPTVELLIAVSTVNGEFGLFHYSGTSFHQVSKKAIGAGIILADSLLSEYGSELASVESSSSVAIYILSRVKKRVDTCGGFTQIVAFKENANFALTDSRDIEIAEQKMEKIEENASKKLKTKIETSGVKLHWIDTKSP